MSGEEQALVSLLENETWGNKYESAPHVEHYYDSGCAICRNDLWSIARLLTAAGYERRPEHVHSWMTLHGGKQQCHACREVRDTPPATPEQIEASRAFLAAQAEWDELRKQVRG